MATTAQIIKVGERQRKDLLKIATCAAIDLEHATRELNWGPSQRTNEFEIAVVRIQRAARLLQSAVVMATSGKDIMDREDEDVRS